MRSEFALAAVAASGEMPDWLTWPGFITGTAVALTPVLFVAGLGWFRTAWRQRADDAQRWSARLPLAMQGAQEALWFWDARRDVLEIVGRTSDTIGLLSPVAGMSMEQWRRYIYAEDLPHYDAELRRVLEGESDEFRFNYRIIDDAGTVRHVRVRGVALRGKDGLVLEAAGSIGNWTEQTKREQQLLLLESAIESTTDGILISDARTHDLPLIFVNSGFEEITGYTRGDVLGRNCRFLQNGDSEQDGVVAIREALQQSRAAAALLKNYTRSGELFWNQLSVAPVRNADGQLTHFVGVMSDVTARLEAERARQRLQQELEQAQRVQHLAALVGGVAHDVHNALVPIITLSEMIRDSDSATPDSSRLAARIYQAGLTIRSLVRTVLDRSRHSEAKEFEIVDLQDVVKDSLDLLGASLPGGVHLRSDLSRSARIFADRNKIHQVVMNLVTNATQAIGPGSGTVDVRLEAPGSGEVLLSISDDGPGMSEETRLRAFEPFYTARPSGLGLGLTIVRALVREHAGWLRIDSHPGKGTTVCVSFPIADEASAE